MRRPTWPARLGAVLASSLPIALLTTSADASDGLDLRAWDGLARTASVGAWDDAARGRPPVDVAAAWFALAASVVVSLLYGTLFLSMRKGRRAAYGWFALGAACGVAYPAFVLGLGSALGRAETSAVALVLGAGSTAAMFFSRAYAGEPAPHRAWWALVLGVALLGAGALGTQATRDPLVVVGPAVLALWAANALAQVRFVVALRRARRELPFAYTAVAIGWPTAALAALPDIVALVGHAEPAWGLHVGNLAIAVLALHQAIALGREHHSALARADDLVSELAERVALLQAKHAEVEVLNDELRRQIAARSRELAEKLAGATASLLATPPTLAPGDVVEGRYRVVKELGQGGMGTVYEIERVADGKRFALKALAGGGTPEHRARFAREAQLVAELDHPNVVSIVDVDLAASGYLFLVMDLVRDGTTLHDIRRRHRDIPWTLGVLAQVAEGLAAIHAKDIVHRDLKPANVLLARGDDGRRPVVKITDFGIATLQGQGETPIAEGELEARPFTSSLPPVDELVTAEGDLATAPVPPVASVPPPSPKAPLTRTGLIFGTPGYMAQELAWGSKHATRASDVFAFGVLAFELLTGRRPFAEGPVAARLEGRPLPQAPKLRKVCPTLPIAVARALDASMAHDPRARPTASELARILHESREALPG